MVTPGEPWEEAHAVVIDKHVFVIDNPAGELRVFVIDSTPL